MKTILAHSSPLRLVKLAAAVLISATGSEVMAQQSAYSTDEFYRQGDAFSERVSGFFARLFKAGSQPTSYQQPAQRQIQGPYSQPGVYRTAPPAAGAAQQPSRYPQSGAVTQQRPANATGAWPNYAQPQAPNYRMAPPAKAGGIAPTGSMAAKKSTTNSSSRKPVFSTSNKTSTPASASTRQQEPEPLPYVAPKENVVKAPTQPSTTSSPLSLAQNEPDPLPKQSFSDSSGNTPLNTSKVTPNQSFPVATPSKTPGRVISPYIPNKELDVKGLPSGSLALDPTTQKVFKVP